MHQKVVLYHCINVHFYSEDDGAECMLTVVVYYIVFAMRNESTIVNSKKIQNIVLFFIIAMHDPTIYLI